MELIIYQFVDGSFTVSMKILTNCRHCSLFFLRVEEVTLSDDFFRLFLNFSLACTFPDAAKQ